MYASLGALPVALPGFTDASFPIQDKGGLFWVSDAARPAATAAIGNATTFISTEEKGVSQWGAAYAGASGSDWVAAAIAAGQAVLVKPSGYAAPAFKVYLTRDPYRLAYNTARSFQGDYAVLAAPSALVAKAEAEVRGGFRGDPTDYGDGGGPEAGFLSALPSWAVPVGVGAALLLSAVALLRPRYKANAKRGYRTGARSSRSVYSRVAAKPYLPPKARTKARLMRKRGEKAIAALLAAVELYNPGVR